MLLYYFLSRLYFQIIQKGYKKSLKDSQASNKPIKLTFAQLLHSASIKALDFSYAKAVLSSLFRKRMTVQMNAYTSLAQIPLILGHFIMKFSLTSYFLFFFLLNTSSVQSISLAEKNSTINSIQRSSSFEGEARQKESLAIPSIPSACLPDGVYYF